MSGAACISTRATWSAAQADFDAAILANPRNVHAHNNRGLVLARQHKLDEAIAGYAAALRIDPEYLLAYTNRARAYEAKGEFELALADYKQAAEREGLSKHDEDARAKAEAKKQLASLTKAIAEGKIGPKAAAEKRVALVIGNSTYQRVPALRNPANDAKALAAALRRLGFTEVRELLDANLAQLGKALKEFGDLAAGADWAVIYFAGHGVEVGGANYLIPVDAALEQQSHIDDETVPLSRVLSKVAGASKMQLVILDACRNNPFVPKMRQAGKQARVDRPGARLDRARERRARRLRRARRHDGARRREREQPVRRGAGQAPRRAGAGDQPAVPQGARRGAGQDCAPAGALHLRLAAGTAVLFQAVGVIPGFMPGIQSAANACGSVLQNNGGRRDGGWIPGTSARDDSYFSMCGSGSTGLAPWRSSKCSCGWSTVPVLPALAITWPRRTTSSRLTRI